MNQHFVESPIVPVGDSRVPLLYVVFVMSIAWLVRAASNTTGEESFARDWMTRRWKNWQRYSRDDFSAGVEFLGSTSR